MMKRYKNVFLTGDLHLGDAAFRDEQKLVDLIKQDTFDCVVFGGDTFDAWRGTSERDLVVRYDQLFKFLQKVKSKVVFIKGNHDPNIDFLKKLGFSVRKRLKYVGALGERVKVLHGHEFDDDCARWEFLTKKIVYLEERLNRVLTKIDNDAIIRMARLMGDVDIKRIWKNFHNRTKYYRHVDALLFGHLHTPAEGMKGKVKYYNWGGWQKDYSLNPRYLVHKNGKFSNLEVK